MELILTPEIFGRLGRAQWITQRMVLIVKGRHFHAQYNTRWAGAPTLAGEHKFRSRSLIFLQNSSILCRKQFHVATHGRSLVHRTGAYTVLTNVDVT